MKKVFHSILLFFVTVLYPCSLSGIEIKIEKKYTIGTGGLILGSVDSLRENLQGQLFIADSKNYKVHKISKQGKHLLSFGERGEGPGEFKFPLYDINFNSKGQLIVCEKAMNVSVFNDSNTLLKRYLLRNSARAVLRLKYAGNNKVIGWRGKNGTVSVNLVSLLTPGELFKSDILSSAPFPIYDPNGKQILFDNKYLLPTVYYSHCGGYTAVARNDRYLIKVLDNKGIVIKEINRDVPAPTMSSKERQYVFDQIQKPGFSQSIKSWIRNNVPQNKFFFSNIYLAGKYVFAERVKENIIEKGMGVGLDVFTIEGEFLGEIELFKSPKLFTKEHLYFVEESGEGDVILMKYSYVLEE